MDPTEITKHIPEVVSVAKVAAASIPFTAIVKRMLGPAADELAEMWKDQVRLYRYERQVKLLDKVEKMAKEAGFTPQAVPPKILFPLLEGASFEDNEDLHTMWAALLANAALDEERVPPGFVAILKEMSPDEARLLRWISEQQEDQTLNERRIVPRKIWHLDRLVETYLKTIARKEESKTTQMLLLDVEATFDALESAQLVRRFMPAGWQADIFSITSRGYQFLEACRPPTPKS